MLNLLKLPGGTHTHLCWIAGISPCAAWIIISKHHKRWQYEATNMQHWQWVTLSTHNNFMCYVLDKTSQHYPGQFNIATETMGNLDRWFSRLFTSSLMRMFFCSPCLRTPEGTQLSYRVGQNIQKDIPTVYIYIHISIKNKLKLYIYILKYNIIISHDIPILVG